MGTVSPRNCVASGTASSPSAESRPRGAHAVLDGPASVGARIGERKETRGMASPREGGPAPFKLSLFLSCHKTSAGPSPVFYAPPQFCRLGFAVGQGGTWANYFPGSGGISKAARLNAERSDRRMRNSLQSARDGPFYRSTSPASAKFPGYLAGGGVQGLAEGVEVVRRAASSCSNCATRAARPLCSAVCFFASLSY